jgi:hypothetical protein
MDEYTSAARSKAALALAAAFIGDEATLRDTMDTLGYSQDQIDARIAAMCEIHPSKATGQFDHHE